MFSIWEVAWSQAQLPQTEGRSFLSPYRWPSLLKPHEIGHHPPALHTGRTDSAGLSWTMTEGPWQGGVENRVLIPSLSHGHEPLAAFQQSTNANCPRPGFRAGLHPSSMRPRPRPAGGGTLTPQGVRALWLKGSWTVNLRDMCFYLLKSSGSSCVLLCPASPVFPTLLNQRQAEAS